MFQYEKSFGFDFFLNFFQRRKRKYMKNLFKRNQGGQKMPKNRRVLY